MNRVGRHLAIRFAYALLGVTVLVALAALSTGASLVDRVAPWVAIVPVAVLAAWCTRARTRALGEHRAVAIAGAGPFGELTASGLVLLGFAAALVAVPGPGDRPSALPERAAVVAGVDGDLVMVGDGPEGAVWMRADGLLERQEARAFPDGFVPVPRRPLRVAGQLLVSRSPWNPARHPNDPTITRWVVLVAGCGFALWLLRLGR